MKKIAANPHDRFFKKALSYPRVAREFLQAHLPAEIFTKIKLASIEISDESFIDEELRLLMTDILFLVEMDDHVGCIYVLIEHLSQGHPLMPFRLLKYMTQIIDRHLQKYNSKKLPMVYPIVFYNGPAKYPYTKDLFELFYEPELARKVFLNPFQLVDLSQIPDQDLKKHAWLSILEMCQKYAFARDFMPLIKDMIPILQRVEREGGETYLLTMFKYLFTVSDVSDEQEFCTLLHTYLTPQLEDKVMITFADRLRAQGMEKGMQKGMEKGMEKGAQAAKKQIAIKLLEKNLIPIEEVAQITGIGLDELKLV